jgi:hypothetical protein
MTTKGASHTKKNLIKRWLVDYWFHSCKWIFLALKVDLFLRHKSLTFSNCFINLYQFLFEEKNDCGWNVLRLKGKNLLRTRCYKTSFIITKICSLKRKVFDFVIWKFFELYMINNWRLHTTKLSYADVRLSMNDHRSTGVNLIKLLGAYLGA